LRVRPTLNFSEINTRFTPIDMASIADGIDFFLELVGCKTSTIKANGGVDHGGMHSASGMCYMVFTFMWLTVYHKISQKDFSAVITASSVVQFVGFFILALKVHAKKSVAGLSSKTFVMFILCLCIRLCSTTIKKGYIPVDYSGHYFYQLMDICSAVLACHLVYCCHKSYVHSYQEEHDTFPISPFVIGSVILALFVHGDFNRNVFFDIVWYTSLYIETVSLVPQLFMMSKIGGKVQGVTVDFVAAIVACKVMNVVFWVWAYNELVDPKTGSRLAGQVIVCSYLFQLFLSADFSFYYVKGWLEGADAIILPQADGSSMEM